MAPTFRNMCLHCIEIELNAAQYLDILLATRASIVFLTKLACMHPPVHAGKPQVDMPNFESSVLTGAVITQAKE